MGAWNDLPEELLPLIARLLTSPLDFVRFSAVSKACRRAADEKKHTMAFLPGLILGYRCRSNPLSSIPRPLVYALFIGCSHGWALLRRGLEVMLVDQSSDSLIYLPPISMEMSYCGIKRPVLSSNPYSTSFLVVAVLLQDTIPGMAFWRPGHKAWTIVRSSTSESIFLDMIHCKDIFYAITCHGCVVAFDLTGGGVGTEAVGQIPRRRVSLYGGMYIDVNMFLVEMEGELLAVAKYQRYCNNGDFYPVKLGLGFEVWKLEKRNWVTVKSLGDRSLFVGMWNASMCFSVASSTKFRENCIYEGEEVYCLEDGRCLNLADSEDDFSLASAVTRRGIDIDIYSPHFYCPLSKFWVTPNIYIS